MDKTAVESKFQRDLDSIATNLVREYQLKFTRAAGNLSSPLLRWLDFTMRYVDQRPRPVVLSDRLPKVDLPPSAQSALDDFVRRAIAGEELNPYQGRGLIQSSSSGPFQGCQRPYSNRVRQSSDPRLPRHGRRRGISAATGYRSSSRRSVSAAMPNFSPIGMLPSERTSRKRS